MRDWMTSVIVIALRTSIAAVAVAASLAVGPPAAGAQGPFEPNDSSATAVGPLTSGIEYAAAIEADNDEDIFYVYVAEPQTQLIVNAINVNSSGYDDLDGGIYDAQFDELTELQTPIDAGESSSMGKTVGPGIYYIDFYLGIASDPTISYQFSLVGNVVGPEVILAKCAAARAEAKVAAKKVRKARKALRRARANGTRAEVRRAKSRLRAAKDERRTDKRAVRRFCSIPIR